MKRLLFALAAVLFVAAAPVAGQEPVFDSGDMQPGGSFRFTFPIVNEGGYHYHCHPHPWMAGMVHVRPDSDGKVATHEVDILEPSDPDAWGYSVEHLVIEAGDTVVWTNKGTIVHTVTESGDGDHGDHSQHGDGADTATHDHASHDHDAMSGDKDAPGLPMYALLALVAIVALRRR